MIWIFVRIVSFEVIQTKISTLQMFCEKIKSQEINTIVIMWVLCIGNSVCHVNLKSAETSIEKLNPGFSEVQ